MCDIFIDILSVTRDNRDIYSGTDCIGVKTFGCDYIFTVYDNELGEFTLEHYIRGDEKPLEIVHDLLKEYYLMYKEDILKR